MTDSRSRSDPKARPPDTAATSAHGRAPERARRDGALGELDAEARLRVRIGSLIAALVVAVLVLAGGDTLRRQLFDVYQRVSPPPTVTGQVEVVAIDGPSVRAVGGWPWSRYVMARLTEQIAARGAKAIGYDLTFSEPDRQSPADFTRLYLELSPAASREIRGLPSMDAVFARVIGQNPVVLPRYGVGDNTFDRDVDDAGESSELVPPEAKFDGPTPAAIPSYPTAKGNLAIIDGAALGRGLVNGPRDRDGVVRRVPLLGEVAGTVTPSLALELVRVAEGVDTIRLIGSPRALSAIEVGRRRVPVDPGGRVALRFEPSLKDARDRVAHYRTTSAADLLRKGISGDAFRGKIVLVGLTGAGTSDVVATPRDSETYGVFIQAQAVDTILRGDALKRPLWAAPVEWGTGLMLVLVSWLGVPRASMLTVAIVALGEMLAAFGGSWFAFQHNLLIDPLPMLAPGAANSAVMVAMMFVEGRNVQRRLRHALEDERVSAARMSGEMAAASEIQSGMLLPRRELARISPAVEVDAVLQPARTVGGDLYDAFLIDEKRLCFLVGDVTGKGAPAALFMALSKAISRSLLVRPGMRVERAMALINSELSRDNGQMMAVSLLVGILSLEDGSLELCCAGHENPLVVDAAGRTHELKLEGGPPLCVVDDYRYPAEAHHLGPGDMLVAFTDGLTEAMAPDGRLVTRDQLLAAVSDAARSSTTLVEMNDRLVARVRAFEAGGEPSDDLTILSLRPRWGA